MKETEVGSERGSVKNRSLKLFIDAKGIKSKKEEQKNFPKIVWGGGGMPWFWKTILCYIEFYWRGGVNVILSYFFNSLCASKKIMRKREGVR